MATVTEAQIIKEISDCEFNDILDEAGEITIAGTSFWPSDILKEMRPNDYSMLKSEHDYEEIEYTCDECGCEYDNEFDAECCCDIDEDEDEDEFVEMFECSHCGSQYEDEDEAKSCCGGE